jgi:hypothetical protein
MILHSLLWLLHLFLNTYRFISCLRPRRAPQPLCASRRKLPKHLAVIFGDYYGDRRRNQPRMTLRAAELEDAKESVRRLVGWCRVIGVGILSVYDQQGKPFIRGSSVTLTRDLGILKAHWKEIQDLLNEEPESFTTIGETLTSSTTSSGASSPQPARRPIALNLKSHWLPTPPPSSSNSSLSLTTTPDSPDSTRAEFPSGRPPLSPPSEEPLLVTLKVFPTTMRTSGDQLEFVPAGMKMRKRRSSSLVAPTLPASPGPLTIHILDPLLGKPHIAATAAELAHAALHSQVAVEEFKLTTQELGAKLEGALIRLHSGSDE